ncbi:MAG: hypothetical protein ABSF49_21370 [Roseiarcus sp.]|uniref:hypothetical protein n=1 Tax=Roseiarcus sp. TaxID=1969460 RepID=UPI003C1BD2DC
MFLVPFRLDGSIERSVNLSRFVFGHVAGDRLRDVVRRVAGKVELIFYTSKYQAIDCKRRSALKKRLGTTFC